MAAYTSPYARLRYDQGVDAKIVVMGNTGVGKTSLLYRYTQNKFDPKNTTSTTGAFFVTKKVNVDGVKVRLQLWDTAGQERFRSMAPMYYRGANAALLLYDITNALTFEDVRGWLEELKKNCGPELIIYIVGSKADLQRHRQVTEDRVRLSLHRWFPPPKPPTPPPPPPNASTLSYIRPRFTSFTSARSVPINQIPAASPPSDSVAVLKRANTTAMQSRGGVALTRSRSVNAATRLAYTPGAALSEHSETVLSSGNASSNSYEGEEDEEEDEQEWGLSKGMNLFEVSAKDDTGIQLLFDTLIASIIKKKDTIEQENDAKRRDSVFLSPVATPAWAAQADEEEARVKASSSRFSCC